MDIKGAYAPSKSLVYELTVPQSVQLKFAVKMKFFAFVCALTLAIVAKNVSPLNAQEIEASIFLPTDYEQNEVVHQSVCDSFILEFC